MNSISTLSCGSRGFTLLELLIALAAGILMIAALSEILISIKEGWARATRIERQASDELLVQQLISRVLEAAIPPEHQNKQGAYFKGMESSIEFSTVPSQSTFALGRMEAHLFLTSQPNGFAALELRLAPPTMSKSAEKPIEQSWTLHNDLKTIEIFYFDKGSLRGSKHWKDRNKLPELIKLHIVFADETRYPFWIIAHPRQTISGDCLLDLTSIMCRES